MKTKKVGIMGGTFNPIHNGHLLLAETARTQFTLDEILFIPSGHPYMKQNMQILPGKIRAEMIALAIENHPFYALSMMEIERPGNTYTYETLEELADKNPDTEYYFILGADSLFALEKWRNPQRIFHACTILAAVRGQNHGSSMEELQAEAERLRKKYWGKIELLHCQNIDISSTMVRERIRKGESVRGLIPDKVIEYVEMHQFYRK